MPSQKQFDRAVLLFPKDIREKNGELFDITTGKILFSKITFTTLVIPINRKMEDNIEYVANLSISEFDRAIHI